MIPAISLYGTKTLNSIKRIQALYLKKFLILINHLFYVMKSKVDVFFRGLKRSLYLLSNIIFLFMGSTQAQSEWTEWLMDTDITYTFQDNINHAVFDLAEESDHVWNAIVSAGRVYQLDNNTRFFINARLGGTIHQDFNQLNQLDTGISLAIRHKFGLGQYQPWIRGSVNTRYIFSNSRIREGYLTTAGIDWGKSLHERLDIALNYRFDYRNSDNAQTIDANKLINAEIEPGQSSHVYDIKGHSIGVQFNTLLTQQWLLVLAYNFRAGDIVSSNSRTLVPRINAIVDAIAIDDALPGWAYRADGKTHRYSVDASYAFLKGHAAFNLGYEYVESHASPFIYRNNQLRVNFNYSF